MSTGCLPYLGYQEINTQKLNIETIGQKHV